jgi:CheY-like chemotaxis protein
MSPKAVELKRIVLVVDDDPTIRRLVTATLRGGSFRVLAAATAIEALRMARAERPMLILLDLRIGNENGLRLCRTLKTEPETAAIKIVVLSGLDSPEIRLKARRVGADGFFAKPFSPLALWQTVDELLGVR